MNGSEPNHHVVTSGQMPTPPAVGPLTPETAAFYRRMIGELLQTDVPFLVGGAYALARYAGIERHTKDFDIFVRPHDAVRTLNVLRRAGCESELTFSHWLGKAWCGDDFVDVIFSSGNGIADVDDEWFAHALDDTVLGIPVRLVPPEEMVWSKAFVMERERFDGADINHLLLHMADALDWHRLLRRFGAHWPVFLAHVTLFRFAYPSAAHRVPQWLMEDLLNRARQAQPEVDGLGPVCRGTILPRQQYLVDIEDWGFRDGRLVPNGTMSGSEIAAWTNAIDTIP